MYAMHVNNILCSLILYLTFGADVYWSLHPDDEIMELLLLHMTLHAFEYTIWYKTGISDFLIIYII